VQDSLLKAVQSFPGFGVLSDPRAWLFRVAHNACMDLLRSRARSPESMTEDDWEAVADPAALGEPRWVTRSALGHFMWLTAAERSSVILMDVLGYTLQEITEITGRSILSVKASLHRGRTRLKEIGESAEAAADRPPPLDPEAQRLLEQYIQRFNARDFDGVRAMLGEEVRLDLVGRARMRGKTEVSHYLGRYEALDDWRWVPGVVEGRPAAIAHDPRDPDGPPLYFALLEFENGQVVGIRDFRHARYAVEALPLAGG
jgi:RNA polymerase sigma-70 factor (ECF subfamily)